MQATGRTGLQLVALTAIGAVGFVAGAYGLSSGWPTAILILGASGLIAATVRSDRRGFGCAWIGALAASAAMGGGYVNDPEYGVGFIAVLILGTAVVVGLAFGLCYLAAALIRERVPAAADRIILGLAGALLLAGLIATVIEPGVTPVIT